MTFHPVGPSKSSAANSVDWLNVVNGYGADPTGAADSTTAIQNALTALPAGGGVVYLPAGTYKVTSDLSVSTAYTWVLGDGNATIIQPGSGGTFTHGMLNITADRCTVSNLQFMGASGTVTSNPAATAIQINGGFHTFIRDIDARFVNGWVIDLESTSSSTNLDLRSIHIRQCAGGIKLEGNGATVGTSMIDCTSAQVGAATGPFANLDAFLMHNAFDLTGVNLNFSCNASTTGHGMHFLGHVANIWINVIDSGGFPTPTAGSGQAGVKIEDDGTGHASIVNIGRGVFQTWDVGADIEGTGVEIKFHNCTFANNQTHGVTVGSTGSRIDFVDCQFGGADGSNGQGAASAGGINIYDLNWSASSGGGGTVRGCHFNSTIAAVSSVGVQNHVGNATAGLCFWELNEFGTFASAYLTTPTRVTWGPSGSPQGLAKAAAFTPGNPANTTSASFVMMGLGSTCVYTPNATGKVHVVITCGWTTLTAAVNGNVKAAFGTGTAPVNGAADTGTILYTQANYQSKGGGIGDIIGISWNTILTGLTLGTAYWFDIATLTSNVADAAAVSSVAMTFEEVA